LNEIPGYLKSINGAYDTQSYIGVSSYLDKELSDYLSSITFDYSQHLEIPINMVINTTIILIFEFKVTIVIIIIFLTLISIN
jgi:hypothetical protein